MSTTTEKPKETVAENGKPARNKKPVVPVFDTETELRAQPMPEGMKAYRCTIPGVKGVGFTYDYNPQNALLRFASKSGGNSTKLEKVANPDRLYGEAMSMAPEALKEFIARVQASAHLAAESPTGNLTRKK